MKARAATLTLCLATALASPLACDEEVRALEHQAYAWSRLWTEDARAGVIELPEAIGAVRALVLEHERGEWTYIAPPADIFVGRPLVVVARINGARLPPDLTLAPLYEVAARLRAQGINVVGVEVDHDAATAALDDYRAWLKREQRGDLRLSVTALPSWGASQEKLCDVVSEMVLQVHAIRAPEIFSVDSAKRWVRARAGCATSVSLPTYSARVDGVDVHADPKEVSRFLRWLARDARGVERVLWFRAPSDDAAWPKATLAAVVDGAPLAARTRVTLVARDDGAHNIVAVNEGNIAGPLLWPRPPARRGSSVTPSPPGPLPPIEVSAERFEIVRRPRVLRAGERLVIGWARGLPKESP